MQADRRHDIDALRALAFGLLIAYHIGMFYVSWGWHVKSNYIAHWLEPLMLIVNQWRMPLIFLISGLAVNFMLSPDGRRLAFRDFTLQRLKRLGLPLLMGVVIIVPPQAYYEALTNRATEPGYLAFLWRYFTFQPWPEGAFAGSDSFVTWNHLWYLPYLLTYTLLLIPFSYLLSRYAWTENLRGAVQRSNGIWIVLGPVAWLLPIGLFIFPLSPGIRHNLFDDWYAHAMFGSFFLLGFLIGQDKAWWDRLRAMRWVLLPLSIVSFALFRSAIEIFTDELTAAQNVVLTFITYLNRVSWIMLILAWGHHLLNRSMVWLSYANRAVFPWYILHQTIIVVAGYELSKLALGPIAEPLAVVACTILGCVAGFWLIERMPRLQPWFGLKQSRTSPPKSGAMLGSSR